MDFLWTVLIFDAMISMIKAATLSDKGTMLNQSAKLSGSIVPLVFLEYSMVVSIFFEIFCTM